MGNSGFGVWGESTVASDNKGSAFVTYHQPCELQISRDWGGSFLEKHQFPEGLDCVALVLPMHSVKSGL